MDRAAFWFTQDLRLTDNHTLYAATRQEPTLDLIYCFEPKWLKPNRLYSQPLGRHRHQLLLESLADLSMQLDHVKQHLNVFYMPTNQMLDSLVEQGFTKVYLSKSADYNLNQLLAWAKENHPQIHFIQLQGNTLFDENALSSSFESIPRTFTQFRKAIEKKAQTVSETAPKPSYFPEPFFKPKDWRDKLPRPAAGASPDFEGGERAAESHLRQYFNSEYPLSYKRTRNALDDWNASTKLSPWLALGCISPRQIFHKLTEFERNQRANESTYWIFFELLWREYFHWYAKSFGAKLFRFQGISDTKPLTTFYAERFNRWCHGQTAFPIVNACMKQLRATGYMSNRGRQLVASCLIHELGIDWRFGAAYFEEQLVDYDVASNWGNWQYLAGVGADPRGSRRFNLDKQANHYDPNGEFVKKWQGESAIESRDSVDAADWPI